MRHASQNVECKTVGETNAFIIEPKEETILSCKEAKRGSGEGSIPSEN